VVVSDRVKETLRRAAHIAVKQMAGLLEKRITADLEASG
jgi:hypothetical protein